MPASRRTPTGCRCRRTGRARGASRDRVLERALDVVEGLGQHDGAAVDVRIEAGLGAELGEPVDGDVHLDGAAARLPLRDRLDEVVRQRRRLDLLEEGDLRMRRRDHDIRAQLLARLEHDTRARSVPNVDAGDAASVRTVAPNDSAALRRAPVTPPIPPRRKAPRTEFAVADVADLVVRHHVGGARRTRPGPRADDAAHRQDTAYLRRLEPVVEQIGDAAREEAGDVGDAGHSQLPQLPREAPLVDDVAGRRDPSRGGIDVRSGPSTSASPASHASQRGTRRRRVVRTGRCSRV